VARAGHELLEPAHGGIARPTLPSQREVGGATAIELSEPQDPLGSQLAGTTAGDAHEILELAPHRSPFVEKMSEIHLMSQYEDRMTVETPEGLTVTVPLAGVGSRFVSAGIDFTIQILLTVAAFVVFVGFGVGGGVGPGLFAIAVFAAFFVYDVSFEVLAGGRTPGKRWTGLRVVRSGGQPVGFVASAIRNVLRLVDFLPSVYLIGIASILVTKRNQRLGDLAADTVVARAPRKTVRVAEPQDSRPLSRALAAWDVSGVTGEELATVRAFLERRSSLDWGARRELARTMAERLRPRVGGVSETDPAADARDDEVFLERLARVKAARG
jgi:uncharacterized RDD family membrane protein YckC